MGISSALGSSALVPAGYGFRNLIINGDFSVAQRGTSFVSGANNDDTYNLDRWTILSDGNDAVDITQATDVPTGGLYSIGLDVETANKKFGIIQFVEQRNITGVQNKTVWLSFKARTTGSSISNVKAAVLSWTGTADTVTSDVVSAWGADGVTPTWATNWTAENTPSNLGVTNSWLEYRLSALVDTSSVKNLAVFIWCDDTSTTVGDFLYITDVQLEINDVPTPFERRPFGVELALCQRYYQRFTSSSGGPGIFAMGMFGGGTSASRNILHFHVPMRAIASSVDFSAAGTFWLNAHNVANYDLSAIGYNAYSGDTAHALEIHATPSSSAGAAGSSSLLVAADATAYIGVNAEL